MSARRRRTNSGSERGPNKENYQYRSAANNKTFIQVQESPKPPPPPARDPNMTCRDRTTEFMSAVKSLQSRQVRTWHLQCPFIIPIRRTCFTMTYGISQDFKKFNSKISAHPDLVTSFLHFLILSTCIISLVSKRAI